MSGLRFALALTLLLNTLIFSGCSYEKKLAKWCARCPKVDSVVVERVDSTIIQVDTVTTVTPADSAFYFAWVECVNNKPKIKYDARVNTRRTNIDVVMDSMGRLQATAIILSDTIISLQNTITRLKIERLHARQVVSIPCPDCSLKWWQKALMWIGAISLLYFSIRLTWFIAKQTPQLKALKIFSWVQKLL